MRKISQAVQSLRDTILRRQLISPQLLDQIDNDIPDVLTIQLLRNVHSDILQYLDLTQRDKVNFILLSPSRKAAGQEQAKKNRARDWWSATDGVGLQQRATAANNIGSQFQKLFPQFASIEENTTQLVDFIKSKGEIFSLEAVIDAYQALCSQGLIWVTPENCGLEGSEMIRGKVLTSRTDFYKILEAVKVLSDEEKEQERVAGLSADSYASEFLQKDEVPTVIQRRIESDIREFCSNHRNYDPTPEGKEILLSWIRDQGLHVCHDSLEASWAANQEKLHAANCIFDEGPSIPVRYNASTLVDHRKSYIPPVEREVTLEPSPTVKRVDMDKLLALPADEFQRVVNGTPGLRELLDGEQE
jgi:hypothetical protein